LVHADDGRRAPDALGVHHGPVQVRLEAHADVRVPFAKLQVAVERAVHVLPGLHVDHHQRGRIRLARHLEQPLHVLEGHVRPGVQPQLGELDRDVRVELRRFADPLQGLDVVVGRRRRLGRRPHFLAQVVEHGRDPLPVQLADRRHPRFEVVPGHEPAGDLPEDRRPGGEAPHDRLLGGPQDRTPEQRAHRPTPPPAFAPARPFTPRV